MTAIPEVHERYGGLITTRGTVRVVAHYGRPERAYRAVRNGAGIIEHGFGVLVVDGERPAQVLQDGFTNDSPETDAGVYGFVLENETIKAEAYVFDVGDRFLALVSPDRTAAVANAWHGDGVTVDTVTREFSVFGVHGPQASEEIAGVCSTAVPETPLSIRRGAIEDAGVTVIRDDGLIGEDGYFLVVASEDSETVFETLVARELHGAPLGYETWDTLTLEAGTPLFDTELRDADPGTMGVANAFPDGDVPDRTDRRLTGFRASSAVERGVTAYHEGEPSGTVTRCRQPPGREDAIGFAVLDRSIDSAFQLGDERIEASLAPPPFVEGTAESARLPR